MLRERRELHDNAGERRRRLAEVVMVALALGGVSAYVWSVITQAESHPGPSAGGTGTPIPAPLRPRDLVHRLRAVDLRSRARTARRYASAVAATTAGLARTGTKMLRARWARRARRTFEWEGRRIRFEDAAELTTPANLASGPAAAAAAGGWRDRPSRLLAAVELVLLIAVVGAVLAAVAFGIGELVARAVGD
jgi:hypothetical protein